MGTGWGRGGGRRKVCVHECECTQARRGGGRQAASPARVDEPLPHGEAAPKARRRCGEAPRVPELCRASGLAAPVAALTQVVV